MVLEALALFALWKLATHSSKKKRVVLRRRRPSTAKSVAAIVGLAAISAVLGPKKESRAKRSRDWGAGPYGSGGWDDDCRED